MRTKILALTASLMLALPSVALAQGIVGGAAEGAAQGNDAAGPVGGVVGGAVGAVVGGVAGLLGVEQRPRFREYVVREHRTSYVYDQPMAVGVVLPEQGITYYDVPSEYGVKGYRYTVINDRPVLVEPQTRRIVEIIE
ncbi:DUF1236 domain-containing protein [Siculibacillus lacustris]|uniref:DUF1236 domain-containing protein n=1 Tax=Siculibacillus lacustris TaxID=1549641 RepID=A0A4Q9VY24_9HYPH|nr:DUF1236 domain-containing protein [Siculibacillus lacustris]TBW40278.1 DUF1236 domain-containing protein [Siculibacillus lacustris]